MGRSPRVFTQPPTFHTADPVIAAVTGLLRRPVAAEIEMYAREWNDIEEYIRQIGGSIVFDGSLSDPDYGVEGGGEINMPPTDVAHLWKILTPLRSIFATARGRVSTRCGCHVHIDATDLSIEDVCKVVRLWLRLEPSLMRLIPESRRNTHYAKSLEITRDNHIDNGNHYAIAGLRPNISGREAFCRWIGMNSAHSDEAIFRSCRGWCKGRIDRYYALNLDTFMIQRGTRRTLEVRMLNGEIDVEAIANWSALMANIVHLGKTQTIAGIDRIPDNFTGLLACCPTLGVKTWAVNREKNINGGN